MSITTDQQQHDDLEVRRRQKQARDASSAEAQASSPLSPAAVRGLVGGLITGTPEESDAGQRVNALAPNASSAPTSAASTNTAEDRDSRAVETIDELVERVKHSTPDIAGQTPRPSRPTGTAELPADAASRRPSAPRSRPRRPRGTPKFHSRPACAVAALTAILGVTIILIANSWQSPTPGNGRPTASAEQLLPATVGDLRLHGAVIAAELRALAQPDKSRSGTHAGTLAAGRHRSSASRSHHEAPQHPVVSRKRTSRRSPTSGTQTPPDSPGEGAASQPTQTSTPSTGTSAASLLGGIGSCIQGC